VLAKPDWKDKTMKKQGNQPQPQMETTAAAGSQDSEAQGQVSPIRANNVLDIVGRAQSVDLSRKAQLMGTARQALAHAKDLFATGDGNNAEATEAADNAARLLYQARTSGLISADEVSGALGDIFGYKPKNDGSPGKTPMGPGEVIRKRVVRAVAAVEFLTGGDGGRFFEGLNSDKVQEVMAAVDNSTLSIWTAYDKLADIKRSGNVTIDTAFDPSKIAKIAAKLGETGAAQVWADSPALVAAYVGLRDVMNIVGEAAGQIIALRPVEEAPAQAAA
jgi:hypothetical protein